MRHQRATIEQAMFCCQSSQSDKVKGDSSSTTLSGKKERCTCYQMTTRKSSERERERKRVCRYLRACVKRQRERGSKCVYLKWERESQGFSATPPPTRSKLSLLLQRVWMSSSFSDQTSGFKFPARETNVRSRHWLNTILKMELLFS